MQNRVQRFKEECSYLFQYVNIWKIWKINKFDLKLCASKVRFLVTTGTVMTAVQIIKISCKMSGLSKLMQLKEINKI